jgi:hypothetical protein
LFIIQPGEIPGALIIEVDFRYRFPVKIEQFIGAKNHGYTKIQYTVIGKGFQYQFSSYPVDVATGYPDYGF